MPPLYRLCAPSLQGYSHHILTQSCVRSMAFFPPPTPTKLHRPIFRKCTMNMCSRAALAGGYAPDFARKRELACTSATRIPLTAILAKQMRGPAVPSLTNSGTHWHVLQTLQHCADSARGSSSRMHGITTGPHAETPVVCNDYTPAEEAFTRRN
ncbi:hypothetical protein KP509_05G009000 [Ceratopteris richardii]|uniref:Uncharacterized protein n=1 Tax=Ceratopteris richardii TaxID=49495 RepID=A0A8T2US62_CERRI|nr:hypothetical protein KP509_05G009000 [Ceratopteris richardii]